MTSQNVLREMNNDNTSTIRRKPVPTGTISESPISSRRNDLSLSTTVDSGEDFITSPVTTFSAASGDEFLGFEPAATPDKPSKFKTAFEETRHFAGGLISHPYESTKHYSILRHSHGLVYFKGFSTNIAITVFADRHLPSDRQFWLQKKGFSGKTGLRIGASIGTKSAWINVTPSVIATVDQLPPTDERAWQRDIEKFLRKAPRELRHHRPVETDILRIPVEAQDGYFRVVLCTGDKGKKTLCPSPVFRLASTSTSVSSLRGASLSTLPAEIGVKIGQLAARSAAVSTVRPLAAAVTGQVKQIIPYTPSGIVQTAALTAFDSTVVPKIDQVNSQYEQSRQLTYDQLLAKEHNDLSLPEVVGDDTGPESPFPFRFSSKIVQGTGRSRATFGMPTANLNSMPDEVRLRLSGTYMGWVSILSNKGLELPQELFGTWYQAIITVTPVPEVKASAVLQKDARTYIIEDFDNHTFLGATISLIVMARLRPYDANHLSGSLDIESQFLEITQDIAITQASLSRPAWDADSILKRIKTDKSNRSLTERYVDIRSAGNKQFNRVPLHKAGIRTKSMGVRDRLIGNGGVYVKR